MAGSGSAMPKAPGARTVPGVIPMKGERLAARRHARQRQHMALRGQLRHQDRRIGFARQRVIAADDGAAGEVATPSAWPPSRAA